MPDFHIRRCRIEVVRTAGNGGCWASSADKTALGRRMARLVRAQLESLLEEAWTGAEDAHLAEAVVLKLPARIDALGRGSLSALPELRRAVADGLQPAAVAAPQIKAPAASRAAPDESARLAQTASIAQVDANLAPGASDVFAMLRSWHQDGTLTHRLALLGETTLWRLVELVDDALGGSGGDPAPPDPDRSGDAGRRRQTSLLALSARAAQDPGTIKTPAERARALLSHVADPQLPVLASMPAAVRPALPLTKRATAGDRRQDANTQEQDKLPSVEAAHPAVHGNPFLPRTGSVHVASALAFILLPILHRTGWLESARTAMALTRTGTAGPALAFALALKTLRPPDRGWRHEPEGLASAAAFAGVTEALPRAVLSEALAPFEPWTDLLAAAVTSNLVAGHTLGRAYLLVRTRDALGLLDPEGLFPLAFGNSWQDLSPALAERSERIHVASSAADRHTLAALAADGHVFVAQGAQIRGEQWESLRGARGWCGITNATPEHFAALAREGARQAPALVQAAAVAAGLVDERRVLAAGERPKLERATALAAGLGLGTLAWTLFRTSPAAWEAPDPLLAWQRFDSLGARVQFAPTHIEVVLPMGARLADLRTHRLTADVPAVPWLGERPLVFSGG